MWLFNVIGVAIGLGMDVFSVSMAVGVRWHGRRQRFRLAWHAGLFQFAMPLVGYALGSQLADVLSPWAVYVAAALVAAVGMKMLLEALRARPGAAVVGLTHAVAKGPRDQADPTRGWSL
ncbi:MAG: manganese efflux pump, partial [Phycisphaerae bacterium]|nr:manganese efflux pump [Phycisphaerae bacterium]